MLTCCDDTTSDDDEHNKDNDALLFGHAIVAPVLLSRFVGARRALPRAYLTQRFTLSWRICVEPFRLQPTAWVDVHERGPRASSARPS